MSSQPSFERRWFLESKQRWMFRLIISPKQEHVIYVSWVWHKCPLCHHYARILTYSIHEQICPSMCYDQFVTLGSKRRIHVCTVSPEPCSTVSETRAVMYNTVEAFAVDGDYRFEDRRK